MLNSFKIELPPRGHRRQPGLSDKPPMYPLIEKFPMHVLQDETVVHASDSNKKIESW